jgi:IS30 family transposase
LAHKFSWYRKRNKSLENTKVKIIWRVDIDQRPKEINERLEKWNYEADLIVSKKWFKWALLTLVDRKTRLPRIFKLKDKSSKNIMNLISSVKEDIWIKSVTFDNWMEFSKHYLLNEVWIYTYFCKPYASWEKWSVENLNRIIRRFFPKGTIFDDVHEEKIKSICNVIANTPREILWFLSPNQVHFQ